MNNMPLVSVIMSVHNGQDYLSEAIESILNQSYKNFELIITDDASTDNSNQIIRNYKDNRIVLIKNEKNIGLTKSLNNMLVKAKGTYIARMDADDISHQDRLMEQVMYLENHLKTDIICTWAKRFGDNDGVIYTPVIPDILKTELFWYNCIVHPTIMMRTDTIRKLSIKYNEMYEKSQDYELWISTIDKITIECLPMNLLYYRSHNEQISNAGREKQNKYAMDVKSSIYDRLNLILNSKEKECIEFLNSYKGNKPPSKLVKNTVEKLIKANNNIGIFPKKEFEVKILLKSIRYFINSKKYYYGLVNIFKIVSVPSRVYSLLVWLKIRKHLNKIK